MHVHGRSQCSQCVRYIMLITYLYMCLSVILGMFYLYTPFEFHITPISSVWVCVRRKRGRQECNSYSCVFGIRKECWWHVPFIDQSSFFRLCLNSHITPFLFLSASAGFVQLLWDDLFRFFRWLYCYVKNRLEYYVSGAVFKGTISPKYINEISFWHFHSK